MIPKILHQTSAIAALPGVLAANARRLRELHPGWAYRFYDDAAVEAFIEKRGNPALMKAYRRIHPAYGAARADLFRYLLMYVEGGVYLDIKSSALRPLDEVLRPDDSYVLAHWPNRPDESHAKFGLHPALDNPRGEFQQWHIMCAPRHPFLAAVLRVVLANIDAYDPAQHGVGRPATLQVTGPIAYSQAIKRALRSGKVHAGYRLAETHTELGLIYSVVERQGMGAHQLLVSPRHYSSLTEPLILRELVSSEERTNPDAAIQ